MDQHVAYIEKMVAKGGPAPSDYASFSRWISQVAREFRSGALTQQDLQTLRAAFGEALSTDTLQGFSLQKPHGYPGDYEILDSIYKEHVSDDPKLENWDRFFHVQSAPIAVRNRKAYFVDLLHDVERVHRDKKTIPVLNVASGPMRDVLEFFRSNGHNHSVFFECVDSDEEALCYAQKLCASYLDRIELRQANALRFRSKRKYQLIWSAGLFDYLSEKGFKFLLEHLLSMLREDGELVVGNFSETNPTRDYMEIIGGWYLHHRTAEELIRFAQDCGVDRADIRIGQEPEGVNLFLHIKRGSRFVSSA